MLGRSLTRAHPTSSQPSKSAYRLQSCDAPGDTGTTMDKVGRDHDGGDASRFAEMVADHGYLAMGQRRPQCVSVRTNVSPPAHVGTIFTGIAGDQGTT